MYINNIFSNSNVQTENTMSFDVNVYPNVYMLETLEYLQNEYFEITKEHTIAVHNGLKYNNPEICTEGLSDVVANIVRVLKKLFTSLKDYISKFTTMIQTKFGNIESLLKDHGKTMSSLRNEITVQKLFMDFTLSDTKIPNAEYVKSIFDTFNNGARLLINGNLKKETVDDERHEFTSEDNLNKLRGKILNIDPITKEDFNKECFKAFHNGKSQEDLKDAINDYHISGSGVKTLITNYESFKGTLNDIRAKGNKMLVLLNDMQKFFNTGLKTKNNEMRINTIKSDKASRLNINDGEQVTDTDYVIANSFYQLKYQQTNTLYGLLNTAYAAKTSALQEAVKNYERVIRLVISAVAKQNNNDKEEEK